MDGATAFGSLLRTSEIGFFLHKRYRVLRSCEEKCLVGRCVDAQSTMICRTSVVTSTHQQLRLSMLGNASKDPENKMSSRAEERAADSATAQLIFMSPKLQVSLPQPQFWTNKIQRQSGLWRSARYG